EKDHLDEGGTGQLQPLSRHAPGKSFAPRAAHTESRPHRTVRGSRALAANAGDSLPVKPKASHRGPRSHRSTAHRTAFVGAAPSRRKALSSSPRPAPDPAAHGWPPHTSCNRQRWWYAARRAWFASVRPDTPAAPARHRRPPRALRALPPSATPHRCWPTAVPSLHRVIGNAGGTQLGEHGSPAFDLILPLRQPGIGARIELFGPTVHLQHRNGDGSLLIVQIVAEAFACQRLPVAFHRQR